MAASEYTYLDCSILDRYNRSLAQYRSTRQYMDFLFQASQLGTLAIVTHDVLSLETIIESIYELQEEVADQPEFMHLLTGCGGTLYAGMMMLRVKEGIAALDTETLSVIPLQASS